MGVSVAGPICTVCRVDMEWFNSVPTPGTTDTLTHSFRCPKCHASKDISAKQGRQVSLTDDAAHWRLRADEMRKMANATDAETKERLLKLANEYDKLAEKVLKHQWIRPGPLRDDTTTRHS